MGGRPCLVPTCSLVPLHGIFLALISRLAFLLIAPDVRTRATSCGGWTGALFSVPARQGKVPCELVVQWKGTLILHKMHTHDGLGGGGGGKPEGKNSSLISLCYFLVSFVLNPSL